MATLQISYEEYAKGVRDYIEKLKNMPKEQAREISLQNLISAGILNEDGTDKENIVNGDFFGW
ncbi:MAG: hypothetical protein IJ711_06760 [Lachnospiraceae bacterium]|nr:hypothetical protein [Lachnospiraceae bacterium]